MFLPILINQNTLKFSLACPLSLLISFTPYIVAAPTYTFGANTSSQRSDDDILPLAKYRFKRSRYGRTSHHGQRWWLILRIISSARRGDRAVRTATIVHITIPWGWTIYAHITIRVGLHTIEAAAVTIRVRAKEIAAWIFVVWQTIKCLIIMYYLSIWIKYWLCR